MVVLAGSIITTGFCGMIYLDTKKTSLDSKMKGYFAAFANGSGLYVNNLSIIFTELEVVGRG
jgi:hypothetical protein